MAKAESRAPHAFAFAVGYLITKANCQVADLLLDAGLPIERAAWGAIAASALGRLDMLRWLVGRGLDLDR